MNPVNTASTIDSVPRRARLHGLVPIMATPFDDTGALDRTSLRRLTEFQLRCGVDGVATFGMASEGFALTIAERATVLTDIRSVIPADLPVVAGVNATDTRLALEQAAVAVDGGATTLMVLPPFLVKPSAAQIVDFYGVLGERSGAEVMVQDAPGATGVPMPVSLIAHLSHLPGVTSVKIETPPTAPKVSEVIAATADDFSVFGGQNSLFVAEEYDRGAAGTMPACEFADALRDVLDLFEADGYPTAANAVTALGPLIRFGMQGPLAWAVHKHVLVQRGVIASDTVRSPAAPLDDVSRRQLDTLLTALQLPRMDAMVDRSAPSPGRNGSPAVVGQRVSPASP